MWNFSNTSTDKNQDLHPLIDQHGFSLANSANAQQSTQHQAAEIPNANGDHTEEDYMKNHHGSPSVRSQSNSDAAIHEDSLSSRDEVPFEANPMEDGSHDSVQQVQTQCPQPTQTATNESASEQRFEGQLN